jgi:hypothetical protein
VNEAARTYVGGRAFDLAFFFGSGALAVILGAALLARPAWTLAAWWAFTLLVEGPHLVLTVTRAYLDAEDRRRLGSLAWRAPLWLLAGPIALLAARRTGSRAPWDLFLLAAALWSQYHGVRQHYGVLAILERHDRADRESARIDGWFLQGALWAMAAVSLVASPANRRIFGIPSSPGPAERVAVLAIAALIATGALGWLALTIARARRGERLWAAWFAAGPVVSVTAFALFVVGQREPLFAAPANPEQMLLAVTAVSGVVHSIQYIGIVAATNRRRYASRADRGLAARLGRAPGLAYLVALAISLAGYGFLNAARGAPSVALFGLDTDLARLFLGLYWGVFFMHYHLDQVIWHPSRDPGLRADLGLVTP